VPYPLDFAPLFPNWDNSALFPERDSPSSCPQPQLGDPMAACTAPGPVSISRHRARMLAQYFILAEKSLCAVQTCAHASVPFRPAFAELTRGQLREVSWQGRPHGLVGINFLEKIQLPPCLALRAMLANVDYVLMGAGIPRAIPALDRLAQRTGSTEN